MWITERLSLGILADSSHIHGWSVTRAWYRTWVGTATCWMVCRLHLWRFTRIPWALGFPSSWPSFRLPSLRDLDSAFSGNSYSSRKATPDYSLPTRWSNFHLLTLSNQNKQKKTNKSSIPICWFASRYPQKIRTKVGGLELIPDLPQERQEPNYWTRYYCTSQDVRQKKLEPGMKPGHPHSIRELPHMKDLRILAGIAWVRLQ